MTMPPPGGEPQWGNRPPGLPQPIALGMMASSPYLTEGVAITCGFAVFGPILASSQVSIEVDGYELAPAAWGRIEVPVLPGTHRFRVFIRRGTKCKNVAEWTGDVCRGELLELSYFFPRWGGVQLYPAPTVQERRRAVAIFLAASAALWAVLMLLVLILT
ncbi:hypothetical protein [Gordonia neofelifaecis]|uniref:Uncharacterized protein n=1 Tax=Gordonia neofelifaecis NRRL B-59395 TaxID=644548 RepID=F1YNA2_9ACTN|nr:hypothetical protein [Gordonia neofelifaecis]EGD53813.1 hypothetical protein SCNU_17003 [Gordonia neofelifaecis NRRL B-59395]